MIPAHPLTVEAAKAGKRVPYYAQELRQLDKALSRQAARKHERDWSKGDRTKWRFVGRVGVRVGVRIHCDYQRRMLYNLAASK
jgi:hypothetical protein